MKHLYQLLKLNQRLNFSIMTQNINTDSNSINFIGSLPPSLYNNAQEMALKAHKTLGCKGFSRVDMLMDCHGNLYLLEVNTIPGFTEKSLLPKAAIAAGIQFPALCKRIVDIAYQDSVINVNV